MDDDEAWELERRLWLEGPGVYRSLVDDECLMAFQPLGILAGPEIIRSLDGAPRWRDVTMTERRIARPAEAIIVLAYRAHSRRDAEAPYAAHCTSTYAKIGDDWRMVQHQQAPAP